MLASEIALVDQLARQGYTWVAPTLPDVWASHADDALEGKPWDGPCTALASTALDIATRRGLPLDQCWRLLVSTIPGSDGADHQVACAVDDDGHFWIIGDAKQSDAYPAGEMTYTPLVYQQMDKVEPANEWDRGAPFTLTIP